MFGDRLINVHTDGFAVYSARGRNKSSASPVTVIPPCVQSFFEKRSKACASVRDVLRRERVCRSVRHLNVVVCHNVYILIVHLLEESSNVGEQIGVYVISHTVQISGRTAPVGVQHEIVDIEIVIIVLLHYRLSAFGGVFVISRLPQSQRGERQHIGSAR